MSTTHGWVWHGRLTDRTCIRPGAAENTVYDFAWANGSLKEAGRISIGPPERRTGGELFNAGFIGGLAISPNGQTLYAVQVFGRGGQRDRRAVPKGNQESHVLRPSRTPP